MEAFGEQQIPGQVNVVTPFEVYDVNPKTDLYIEGGDLLTIDGRGFPDNIDDITVTLSDGTECNIQSLTST